MKKILGMLFAVLLVGSQAQAGAVRVLANGFNVTGTTVTKSEASGNITAGGDIRTQVTLDANIGADSSKLFYWHFPYPDTLPDSTTVYVQPNYTSNDPSPDNLHCLRSNMFAQMVGYDWRNGDLTTGACDEGLTTPLGGNSGNRQFIGSGNATCTIRKISDGTACTQTACGGFIVRGVSYRQDAIADCSGNPISTAAFFIQMQSVGW